MLRQDKQVVLVERCQLVAHGGGRPLGEGCLYLAHRDGAASLGEGAEDPPENLGLRPLTPLCPASLELAVH